MNTWHNIHITDASGKKFFNTSTSPLATASEIKNITRHLEAIRASSKTYAKVGCDAASAVLMLDGVHYGEQLDISEDDLLAELFDL